MTDDISDEDRKAAHELCVENFEGIDCDHGEDDDLCTAIARAIRDARQAATRRCIDIVGKVVSDNGCDCCDDEGNAFDGPHENESCESLGHEPCQMCQVNDALNIAARRGARPAKTGREG